jgi:dTDP-4-amino-4,6-dideoxygalactose transaminase
MSIINSFRWNEISRIRRSNWKILHELIGNKVEPLFDKLPKGVVPLGYVIRTKNRDIIKEKLAQKRIFAPVHWRLPSEVNKNKFPDAVKLSDTVLTLPIDQRYGLNDMVYISNSIKEIL